MLLLVAFILTGCSSVKIKDSTWYADEGPLGSAEFRFMHFGKIRDVPKVEWDNLRFGMACTPLSNVIELKGNLEKLCQNNMCTFEQQKIVEKLAYNLEQIQNEIQK